MAVVAPVWQWLDSGPCDPAWNMAVDEALLEHVGGFGAPVLRLYGWTVPASTFGYFQKVSEVEAWTHVRPLIRRCTGGGLVPHGSDWTYSLAVPPSHEWYEIRAADSYRRMHGWLKESFNRLGCPADLAPECNPDGPGRCFIGAERDDLVIRGRKIAGAAQRRNRLGLLLQGSVQPVPAGVSREEWIRVMLAVASELWGCRWETMAPGAAFERRCGELVRLRYATDDHLRRR